MWNRKRMHFCLISALSLKVISPPNTFCLQEKRDYIFHYIPSLNCMSQINLCAHFLQKKFWRLKFCTREYLKINHLRREIMRILKLGALYANVSIKELNRMQRMIPLVKIWFPTNVFISHAEKLHLPLLQLTVRWTEMELQDTAHWTCEWEEISDISKFISSNLNCNF